MDDKLRDRIKRALESNRTKDMEFEQKRAEQKAAANLEAKRKEDAKTLWPEFVEKVGRAATSVNNQISESGFLLDVDNRSSDHFRKVSVNLMKDNAAVGMSALFVFRDGGKVAPSFNGAADTKLTDLDIFAVEQHKIEMLLVALFEHYVRQRPYQTHQG